jgi:predicted dienelactone hydrolase
MKEVHMSKITRFTCLFLSFLLVSCGVALSPVPAITGSEATADTSVKEVANNPTVNESMALSEPGLYAVKHSELKFYDSTRGQEIEVSYWLPIKDGEPDLSGAPYPVIIYSHGGDVSDGMFHRFDNEQLLEHLVSYGYVAFAPGHKTEKPLTFTDRPMDILALIDELDQLAEGEFVRLLDMNNISMIGTSAGSATALQMGGARLDDNYLDTWCIENPGSMYCPSDLLNKYHQAVSETLLKDSEGLYYVKSDPRIRAVAILSPCFYPVFGKRGLAPVSLPIILLAPTRDGLCSYKNETVLMYNYLGSKDRFLINLIDGSHISTFTTTRSQKILFTAFFGYYIKNQEEYTQYLKDDYVNNLQGLSWGVYQP